MTKLPDDPLVDLERKDKRARPLIAAAGAQTRFRPGVSGNPGGKPKSSIEKDFRAWLKGIVAGEGNERGTRMMQYFERLHSIAMNGEAKDAIAAIKFMVERGYGLPRAELELTTLTPEQRDEELRDVAREVLAGLGAEHVAAALAAPNDVIDVPVLPSSARKDRE